MTKTLYVGNLPADTNEQELTAAFEAHGQVISTRIIIDRETGRSKGFGFIETEDADSMNLINSMNGAVLNNKPLIVNEARPKAG